VYKIEAALLNVSSKEFLNNEMNMGGLSCTFSGVLVKKQHSKFGICQYLTLKDCKRKLCNFAVGENNH
jgi:hypothetical protein